MLFTYEASDKKGFIVKGEFDASSKEDVLDYLEKKKLIPVSVEEKTGASGEVKQKFSLSFALFETISPLDRIILVRNLAATVRAGLNMLEALDILITDAKKNIMKKILGQARINLQNGQPLSVTFQTYRKFFPPVFVGMLRSGETAGHLEGSLDELSHHLTRDYNLTRKIKSSMAYPIILAVASIGVIVLLLVFILPRLAKVFKQSGAEIPFITQLLLDISGILTYSPVLDVAALIFLIWFFSYFRKTDLGRSVFLKIVMAIPVMKELVKKIALVRFTRTLGSLITSGTPILEALNLASESVGNEYYRKAILESIEGVKNGVPFSKTLEHYTDLFPKFLTSLIVVGERTGTLEHILKTFADFYDDEVDHALKNLTTFVEPVLLLFMGLVIGTVALSILLPIYQLVGEFL